MNGDILVAPGQAPPTQQNERRADLVLEGGGVKGIGLVGAIEALMAGGFQLGEPARVAGTSAGAIVGSFLAAGMPVQQMRQELEGYDFGQFLDGPPLGALGRGFSLLTSLGMYRGDALHRWISDHLAALDVHTFADLRLDDDPDSDLPPERAFKLVVVVSDVSTGHMVRLPWDFHHYGLVAEEQSVADAVRASASIPVFFQPVRQATKDGRVVWVDGGLLSNYPITIFDRRDTTPPRWPTFGVKLSARPPAARWPIRTPVRGPFSYAQALVRTMAEAHDRLQLDEPSVLARTIFVDSANVQATDFHLSKAARLRLYENGQKAAEKFLTDWDFHAYLAKHRS